MAKTIFRGFEVNKKANDVVFLQLNKTFQNEPEEEIVEDVPVYEGPSIEDLKKEAEDFKIEWEKEKEQMFAEARAAADKIIKEAENAAFDEVKRQTDEAQVVSQKAKDEAKKIIAEAEASAKAIISDAQSNQASVNREGYQEGFSRGREEGYKEGELEVKRLITRLQTIITKTMDRRQEILSETEQQIVDLVLLMTRKVVKVISENQRNVVVSNVVHALRKVKGRGDVIIRVNLADVGMTTEHTKNFISTAENIKNITVVEDSTVDQGGCIIETDFGAVDAKIASQLNELEQKILEISPIKTKIKTGNI
ncbi:flagellar assembly protein FliH [Treponema pedis]|uniref:Flagellar assembly protein FliH n=1 Tax=Treponema pedis str. T A4 TaxID=1291379 RepID=S6A8X3_9SPIR|nr:flagellar assembly protein FliH [Treponema pedis]AGT44579.1 flagellar assembly protein H [Treponema pedis str. T A4]